MMHGAVNLRFSSVVLPQGLNQFLPLFSHFLVDLGEIRYRRPEYNVLVQSGPRKSVQGSP